MGSHGGARHRPHTRATLRLQAQGRDPEEAPQSPSSLSPAPGTDGPPSPVPAALSHLLVFTVLAGLLLALLCVALLALLAVRLWPR